MEADADTAEVSPHHVLLNAHPAFGTPESIAGMINEPVWREAPTLKMIHSYAHFLADDDPQMQQRMLTQPAGAEAAWREHVRQPMGFKMSAWRCSERMVLYMTTRGSYSLQHELTTDYGGEYARNYYSGSHRPTFRPLYEIPPEVIGDSEPATWPNLRGWFNPKRQPNRWPAFEEIEPRRCGGRRGVRVLPDAPEIVAACKAIKAALKRKADTSPFSSFKARSMVSDEVEEEIGRDTTLAERMMRLVSSRQATAPPGKPSSPPPSAAASEASDDDAEEYGDDDGDGSDAASTASSAASSYQSYEAPDPTLRCRCPAFCPFVPCSEPAYPSTLLCGLCRPVACQHRCACQCPFDDTCILPPPPPPLPAPRPMFLDVVGPLRDGAEWVEHVVVTSAYLLRQLRALIHEIFGIDLDTPTELRLMPGRTILAEGYGVLGNGVLDDASINATLTLGELDFPVNALLQVHLLAVDDAEPDPPAAAAAEDEPAQPQVP